MMFRAALMTCLFVAPALAQDHTLRGSAPWDGKAQARDATMLKSAMLDKHNEARIAYGVPALAWDEALEASARAYAQQLAATDTFEHDDQDDADEPEGENLYMGTRTAYSYAAMAKLWIDEQYDFKPGRFPEVVRAGHWSRVGHYTQIIWPTTQRVGCAMASNASDDYLVCRYFPAGNYFGTDLRQKTAATSLANASAR